LRDPPLFRDAFLVLRDLPAVRDFARVFAFLRRFFAMRAPCQVNWTRILSPVVVRMERS
jgi:hypothetical protein